jgi:hypothetical protein
MNIKMENNNNNVRFVSPGLWLLRVNKTGINLLIFNLLSSE